MAEPLVLVMAGNQKARSTNSKERIKAPDALGVIKHCTLAVAPADLSCCLRAVAGRLRRSLLQLGDQVTGRMPRWKDVIKNTAQTAWDLGRWAERQGTQSIKRDSYR